MAGGRVNTVKALIAEAREVLESDRTAVQLDTLHSHAKGQHSQAYR